jgi:hypothetical protein
MASSCPLSSFSLCPSVWFHLLPRPVLLPLSTSIFLLEFPFPILRRSPRPCQPRLPTCKRHKIPLKMHRFQSLFPSCLTPLSIHLHVILSYSLLLSFLHILSSHFPTILLLFSSILTVLNSSRVGMATKRQIFPITLQDNAYIARAVIQDLTVTNKIAQGIA